MGDRLAPAFEGAGARADAGGRRGQALRLSFDTDQIDALSSDREALWARVGAAEFLTVNEKRTAVGYSPRHAGGEHGIDSWVPAFAGMSGGVQVRTLADARTN